MTDQQRQIDVDSAAFTAPGDTLDDQLLGSSSSLVTGLSNESAAAPNTATHQAEEAAKEGLSIVSPASGAAAIGPVSASASAVGIPDDPKPLTSAQSVPTSPVATKTFSQPLLAIRVPDAMNLDDPNAANVTRSAPASPTVHGRSLSSSMLLFSPSSRTPLVAATAGTIASGSSVSSANATVTAAAAATVRDSSENPFEQAIRKQRGSVANRSMVEDDLERMNNNIIMIRPSIAPPPFANMLSCDNCREDIGTLLGKSRHHCRNCGGSFCGDCAAKVICVPYPVFQVRPEGQRVCDHCYNRIREFYAQAGTTKVSWTGLDPPCNEEFIQDFELPVTEVPVSIFNCCFFSDCLPFYGHLFLTRENLCFKGYKMHQFKVSYGEIQVLVKPEFYYINALQVKKKDDEETFFFAEFNGLRDMCFLRLDQLIRAYQEGNKVVEGNNLKRLSTEDLFQQALIRRKSYRLLVNAEFVKRQEEEEGSLDYEDQEDTEGDEGEEREDDEKRREESVREELQGEVDGMVEDDEDEDEEEEEEESSAIVFDPPVPDELLLKTTIILDCELPAGVRDTFDQLWSDGDGRAFQQQVMEASKEIDIMIEEWQPITPENQADVNKGFNLSTGPFERFRHVTCQHPHGVTFPGLPPLALCESIQRYCVTYATCKGLNQTPEQVSVNPWNRLVVTDLKRFRGIPMSDYFEVETRWVFSRDGKDFCHCEVGLVINYLKSTWFKSQISSSTVSESRKVQQLWAQYASNRLREWKATKALGSSAPSPVKPLISSTSSPPPSPRAKAQEQNRSTSPKVRSPTGAEVTDTSETKGRISVDAATSAGIQKSPSRSPSSSPKLHKRVSFMPAGGVSPPKPKQGSPKPKLPPSPTRRPSGDAKKASSPDQTSTTVTTLKTATTVTPSAATPVPVAPTTLQAAPLRTAGGVMVPPFLPWLVLALVLLLLLQNHRQQRQLAQLNVRLDQLVHQLARNHH